MRNELKVIGKFADAARTLSVACVDAEKDGLMITKDMFYELASVKDDLLARYKLYEIKGTVMAEIVRIFSDSPFVYQDNCVEIFGYLAEIFYEYRDEIGDGVSDEEILSYMKKYFDGICQGSIEALESDVMPVFARKFEKKKREDDLLDKDDYEPNLDFDEEDIAKAAVYNLKNDSRMDDVNCIRRDRALQSIGAVSYILNHANTVQSTLPVGKHKDIMIEYDRGLSVIRENVQKALTKYNQIASYGKNYGNADIKVVLEKEIPIFFRRYDDINQPQDSVISFDYPIMIEGHLQKMRGIEALSQYLECIGIELDFLNVLDANYVSAINNAYMIQNKSEYFNLTSVVLKNVLTRQVIRNLHIDKVLKDRDSIYVWLGVTPKEKLKDIYCAVLKELIDAYCFGNEKMYQYFEAYICNWIMNEMELDGDWLV